MANQMIALQARAPQSVGLGNAIQQNAQMINMMRQQEADERRNMLAAQKLEQEQALLAPQMAEAKSKAFSAEQKALTDFLDVAAKVIGISKSPEDVRFGADMLKKQYDNPIFAQIIDQTIKDLPEDPQTFGAWRNQTKLETLDAKDQIPYLFEQLSSKEIIGEGGNVGVLTTGGINRAPTLVTPETYEPDPMGGEVEVEPSETVEPIVGGPDENAIAELAGGIVNAENDRDYQTALALLERQAPDMAAQVRSAMPRFDPARIQSIRAALQEEMGGETAPLVEDMRGGVGGPYKGYVRSGTPFRARVPAPPSQPQPRETAEEVGRKEAARLEAQRQARLKAGPPPPAPLTEAQRLARRDKMAAEMTKAQALINKTFDPKIGIVAAVNKVKSLSEEQKESATGWSSYLPSLRESARLADAALADIKGIVIDLGKTEASDSGSIGNMAVQEWTIVANMIASLDYANMTPSVLQRQMNIIERRAVNAADLTKQAYEARFRDELKAYPEFKLKVPPRPKSRTPVNKGGNRISPDIDKILKGLGI